MTNEDFQSLLLKELKGLKEGQQQMNECLSNVESRLDSVEMKLDKISETPVDDTYTLMKLIYGKVEKLDGKFEVLNKRLFDQEAEIQVLKRVK